ncbi:hypothetical protein ES705_25206 [subsurface metagenome]
MDNQFIQCQGIKKESVRVSPVVYGMHKIMFYPAGMNIIKSHIDVGFGRISFDVKQIYLCGG